MPLRAVLPHRQTWAFAVAKFLTDPVWWLYLFWIPDFLSRNFGVKLLGMVLPIFVIYQVATIGSIGGGWLSGSLLRRGWSVNAAQEDGDVHLRGRRRARSSSRRRCRACGWRWG